MFICSYVVEKFMKYTTIRISIEDKKKLERLSKKLSKNLADTLRYAIEVAEREADKFKGDVDKVLSTLKHARSIEETNAEKVDEYLYGGTD